MKRHALENRTARPAIRRARIHELAGVGFHPSEQIGRGLRRVGHFRRVVDEHRTAGIADRWNQIAVAFVVERLAGVGEDVAREFGLIVRNLDDLLVGGEQRTAVLSGQNEVDVEAPRILLRLDLGRQFRRRRALNSMSLTLSGLALA